MNDKESAMYKILDIVVECCATDIGNGVMSLTREDVLGKSRAENVVMTRAVLARLIVWNGYSVTTVAQLLGKSPQAVRHLLELGQSLYLSSRAYRIAEAQATIRCKDID